MFVRCLSFCGLGGWWVVGFQVSFFFNIYAESKILWKV